MGDEFSIEKGKKSRDIPAGDLQCFELDEFNGKRLDISSDREATIASVYQKGGRWIILNSAKSETSTRRGEISAIKGQQYRVGSDLRCGIVIDDSIVSVANRYPMMLMKADFVDWPEGQVADGLKTEDIPKSNLEKFREKVRRSLRGFLDES